VTAKKSIWNDIAKDIREIAVLLLAFVPLYIQFESKSTEPLNLIMQAELPIFVIWLISVFWHRRTS